MTRTAKAGRRMAIDDDRPASSNYHAHALARGLALLELLATAQQPMTLTEFHEQTDLPKSTLVRLLAVLTEMNYVTRVDERPAFRLAHKVLDLSTAYVSSLDAAASARPYLAELASDTGYTANLGVLDGDQVLHLCVVEPDRPIRYTAQTGSRDFAYCTGLGKLLLSRIPTQWLSRHLPDEPFPRRTGKTIVTEADLVRELRAVERRGYAFDDDEDIVGLRCLAVPVEVDGDCVAALSLSGPSGEFTPSHHAKHLEPLRATAARMSSDRDLGAVLRITHRSLLPVEQRAVTS